MSAYCTVCSRSHRCWKHSHGAEPTTSSNSQSRGPSSSQSATTAENTQQQRGGSAASSAGAGGGGGSVAAEERKRRQMDALERLEEIQRRLGKSTSPTSASPENKYISPPSAHVPAAVPVAAHQVRFNPVTNVREPSSLSGSVDSGDAAAGHESAAWRGSVGLMADRGGKRGAVDELLFSPTPAAPPATTTRSVSASNNHRSASSASAFTSVSAANHQRRLDANNSNIVAFPTFPHDTSMYRAVESIELLREGFFSLTEAVKEDIATMKADQKSTIAEAIQQAMKNNNSVPPMHQQQYAPPVSRAQAASSSAAEHQHLNNSRTETPSTSYNNQHYGGGGGMTTTTTTTTTSSTTSNKKFISDLRRKLGLVNHNNGGGTTTDESDRDVDERHTTGSSRRNNSSSTTTKKVSSNSKRTLRLLLGEAEDEEAEFAALGRWGGGGGTGASSSFSNSSYVSLEQFSRFRSAIRGAMLSELEGKDQQIAALNRKVEALAEAVDVMKTKQSSSSTSNTNTHNQYGLVSNNQQPHICEELVVAKVLAQLQPTIEHVRTSTKSHMSLQRALIDEAVSMAVQEHLESPGFSRRREECINQLDANLKQLRSDVRIAFKGICSSIGCMQPAL